MESCNPSFRSLDELDTALAEVLAEIRFIVDLAGAMPPQSVVIDSNDLTTVLSLIARQLDDAREITRREVLAMRKS